MHAWNFCAGPSAPTQPINVVHTTLSSDLAVIQWLIPFVMYTPENYTIVYWEDQSLLNYSSDVVIGTDDITLINQVYSVTLSGLESNTSYYYQVIARNNIGTNSSDVRLLETPLPSKYYYPMIRTCLITLLHLVLEASVNSIGNQTVGEMFTLVCRITRVDNITGDVILQWIGPDGNQVVNMGAVTIGAPLISEATTSLSLQFSTLFTSHGGEYTCQADFVSQDTTYTISVLQDVIVHGMWHVCIIRMCTLSVLSMGYCMCTSILLLYTNQYYRILHVYINTVIVH